ncbi:MULTISPECIES: amidohydrolase family protein [unclassified Streptomyces]|uniref:amidohydrolase family protein n=1 Tax=unclassified Streptomyces TaxID=2593676 RepID=UPI00332AA92D
MVANPLRGTPVVDTHAHLYPATYLDRLVAIGADPDTVAVARNLRASDEPEELEARLRQMDAAGVGVQVLSAVPQVPMVDDAGSAARAARMVNDQYAAVLAAHSDRFRAYGCLPVPHVEASVAQTRYCLDELGFLGVALPTVVRGDMTLADGTFDPLWAALDARGARVYLHATGGGANCPLINDHQLQWVNGAPLEDALAVLHLLKADVPARFPGIRFHVAHLGGDLPFLAQRIEDNYEDWRTFERSPRAALRNMWFDSANFHGPSLRLAMETVDPGKVMMGSDYPYFQDDKYTRAVGYVRDSGLSETLVEAVLSTNAMRFYDG